MRSVLSPRRRNLAAFVAAGALVVAGCGGDGGGATPAATDASAPVTVGDADPIADDEAPAGSADPSDPVDDAGASEETGGPADAADDAGDGAQADQTAPPATVPEILQVSAPLIGDGGDLDLAELGDRPVLLWFWSPF